MIYGNLEDPIQGTETNYPQITEPGGTDAVQMHYNALDSLISLKEQVLPPPEQCFGDGVVIVGGGKFSEGIVIACRMLRKIGSTLPIQVWHRGPDQESARVE